jgi:mRNA interferase MazF
MSTSYRWRVFLANLDPVIGSEQGRTRPVLVISEEEINQILPVDALCFQLGINR